ncbi:hypothetical protein [Microbispora hainanensis]|uniref:Bacterial HORMA domain-containing protein n=1 Tax=Microbispora hainanensis TaxID=568844 RepID=A0A544YVJ5_9ACTN|nr:hypothetical protein [Microbispora hainanensis]TQS20787.1 hypothetical protein FLX08_15075 [Microbispora hainanensis]
MATSYARSATFTLTDARYVGAKVGADLRQLNSLYGNPTLASIDKYTEEIALLLKDGYLDTVDFGFRDVGSNAWKLRLRYRATTGGQLVDSRPGRLPASIDVVGLSFHSYLTYSPSFHQLTTAEQARFKESLPVTRTGAAAPTANAGVSQTGYGYARNGAGVDRDVYQAF